MSGLAALLAGSLVSGGVVAVVAGMTRGWSERAGAHRRPETWAAAWARWSRRPPGARGRRRDALLVASLLVGLALAFGTGWLVAVVAAPTLALGLPYLLSKPPQRDVELMEALDRWVRSLAATLATGRSITDAIRVSRRTAPPLLAEELSMLVARLNNRWDTREALIRFADGLDSPDADAVVAALILAASRGANGASVTLHALADSLQDQLRGRRIIEVERSKPYVVVRQVTTITLVAMGGIWLLNPAFFSAYKSPVGQGILAVLVVLYVGSLLLLRRKARQRPRERILVGQPA